MSDKKYTPQEAAILVLKKTQELYNESPLAKGEWSKIHNKLESEGYSKESADKIDGSIKAKVEAKKLKKDEDMGSNMAMSEENPDEKEDAELGEKVEREVEDHEESNEDPKHEMKGHIKLAKFMGRMEHKRGQQSKEMDKGENASQMSGKSGKLATAETGHEKGINVKGNQGSSQGISEAGSAVRNAPHSMPNKASSLMSGAKDAHKETLNQIHQMSKPKLPG